MLESIIIGVIVKLCQMLLVYLAQRVNAYSKKIEKGNLRQDQAEKLLLKVDNAVEKAERIQSTLDLLNRKRL